MKNFLFALPLLIMAWSCTSPRNVLYLQNIENSDISASPTLYEQRYTQDDQLGITVTALNPMAVSVFNLPIASYPNMGNTEMYSNYQLQVYTIDAEGNINYPVIGKIKVAGLTRTELVDELQRRISVYAENPIVTIQLTNFKITVLGEVNRPGPIKVTSDRVSLLDAIGAAGDLTIYGDRKKILLVRENNGVKESKVLDISSPEIINSPYYYLSQNDVLYIAPNRPRQANSQFSQMDQYNIQIISTVISAISVFASLAIALLIKN